LSSSSLAYYILKLYRGRGQVQPATLLSTNRIGFPDAGAEPENARKIGNNRAR
jgi:hypothetical protein